MNLPQQLQQLNFLNVRAPTTSGSMSFLLGKSLTEQLDFLPNHSLRLIITINVESEGNDDL